MFPDLEFKSERCFCGEQDYIGIVEKEIYDFVKGRRLMKDAIKTILIDSILNKTFVNKYIANDISYRDYSSSHLYDDILKQKDFVLDIKALITNIFTLDKDFCKRNPKFTCEYVSDYDNTIQSYFRSLEFISEHIYDFVFAVSFEDQIRFDYDIHIMVKDAFVKYRRHLVDAIENKGKLLNFETPQRALNTFTRSIIDIIYRNFDYEHTGNIKTIYEFIGYKFVYKDFYVKFKRPTSIVEIIFMDRKYFESFELIIKTYNDQLKDLEKLMIDLETLTNVDEKAKKIISTLENYTIE